MKRGGGKARLIDVVITWYIKRCFSQDTSMQMCFSSSLCLECCSTSYTSIKSISVRTVRLHTRFLHICRQSLNLHTLFYLFMPHLMPSLFDMPLRRRSHIHVSFDYARVMRFPVSIKLSHVHVWA